MKSNMADLDVFLSMLRYESVSFFGDGCEIPVILREKQIGRLDVFSARSGHNSTMQDSRRELNALSDIPRYGSSICFLSGTARRVLVAKYPNGASFVAIRLSFSLDLPFLIIGLLRRLKKRAVKIAGLKNMLCENNSMSYWLVLSNQTTQVGSPIYLSISDKVGAYGLISFLNNNDIRYVVPRFFEKFPDLYRPNGGDIDILVHDDDADLVRTFLRKNSGCIPVDLHSVFGPAPGSGDMPYYIPKLALEMLADVNEGPLGVKTPNQENYFLSFLYHILFHKGFSAGVPSQKFPEYVSHNPENRYLAFAENLAREVGYEFNGTMEDAENILKRAGFIPKLDTLAAISRVNSWVKKNYFENVMTEELGYSVVILKRIAADREWVEPIKEYFAKQNFLVIKSEVFSKDRVEELSCVLRGGNWYVPGDDVKAYFPYSAYLLKDQEFGESYESTGGKKETRIRILKEEIRKKFDNSLHSFIHATDDTAQASEYVEDIWGSDFGNFKRVAPVDRSANKTVRMSVVSKFRLKIHIMVERGKQLILRYFE